MFNAIFATASLAFGIDAYAAGIAGMAIVLASLPPEKG
jgi:hypothetical protein